MISTFSVNGGRVSRTKVAVLAALFSTIFALGAGAQTARPEKAETLPEIKLKPVPGGRATVVIAAGDIDSTETQVIDEMARALSDAKTFRIIPVIGQGSVQSISDLLDLRRIDAAVVQYDVLSQFRKSQRIPGIENKMQYITKLFSQEFHVLSRMQFTCLADLDGRKVNFGPLGSGAAITAEIVFGDHKLKVQPLFLDHAEAFEKLKSGEIDAMVYVGGKPARAFGRIKYTDKVHFLDVDYIDSLQKDYLPAILTHDDYPDLIAPDETVTTVAVSSVLLMAGQRSQSEQYRQLAVFVDQFFSNYEALRAKPFHEKWREINILAPVPGWQRFPAAQSWLDTNSEKITRIAARQTFAAARRPAMAQPSPQRPEQGREALRSDAITQAGAAQGERDELFDQFVRWYENQAR